MKRYFATITASLLVAICFGKSYKINGIMYDLNGKEAKVVAKNTSTGKITIPQTVKYKNATYTVTAIGPNAFKGCKTLKSVTLPASVTEIGTSAFIDCKALTTVTIPEGITLIAEKAFARTGLTTVVLPTTITKVEDDAFMDCMSLSKVELHNSTMRLSPYAFNGSIVGELTFGEGCTNVFRTYINMNKVTLASSVTSISDCAFWDCATLTSISLPESLTTIGNSAFNGCKSLVEINIPESITEIDSETFFNCSSLSEITIPSSVTKIGDRVFSGCTSLTQIMVSADNKNYTSVDGVLFTADQSTLLAYPNAKGTEYVIPSSVKSIAPEAFCDCTGLTSVVIPSNVKNIGKRAFTGCTALASVTNFASGPQTITSGTFSNPAELHVLKGKKRSYSNSEGWSEFNIIDDLKKK